MNKKGKNKKGKVPNPGLSQQEKNSENINIGVISEAENSGKNSEIIEIVNKNESSKEDRVPTIISEIDALVSEVKDEETPKKPKRNRAKKKKDKDNEMDDNIIEEPSESAQNANLEDIKKDTLEMEPLENPTIAPTTRKKKNRKKNLDQKSEQPIAADFVQATLLTEAIGAAEHIEEKETKSEISSLPETEEQAVKVSKKKNKKKKRTDSEKSEKEDMSCTTTLHKSIETIDDTLEIKMEEKVEDNIKPIKSESHALPEISTLPKKKIIEKNTECQEHISLIGTDSQQIGGKGKKKNKKEKLNISQTEETKCTEGIIKILSLPTDSVGQEPINKDILDIEKVESIAQQDTCSKPKAKIIKPVEKKPTVCQDNQSAENIQSNKYLNKEVLKNIAIQETDDKINFEVEPQNIQQDCQQQVDKVIISETTPEPLKLSMEMFKPLHTSDKAIDDCKQRKKESKLPKTPDVSFEILDHKDEVTMQHDANIVEDLPIVTEASIIPTLEKSITSELPVTSDFQTSLKLNVEEALPCATVTKGHILLTPESVEDGNTIKLCNLTPIMDEQKPENKSAKKLKKSPKSNKKIDNTQKDLGLKANIIVPNETALDMTKEIESSNITRMYDIEISSIKAEKSESVVCDTIPDVTHPRSVSEHLMDDNNNNTVITEILPSQLSAAEIQKNIENPKTVSKEISSPPKEEKTDLKSKMMEVNQDMEELRLSIERSLAELTAMERSEVATEKEYEDSKLKIDKNMSKTSQFDITIKSDDHAQTHQEPNVNVIAVESPSIETLITYTQNSEKKLEEPLLPLDSQGQQKTTTVKTSVITESITESTDKEIPIEQFRNTPSVSDTATDSIIFFNKEQIVIDSSSTITDKKSLSEHEYTESLAPITAVSPTTTTVQVELKTKGLEEKLEVQVFPSDTPPVCPARKDHKNKHKKKKGKQDLQITSQNTQSSTSSQIMPATQEAKKEEKADDKKENKSNSKDSKAKGKQQSNVAPEIEKSTLSDVDYEPIENFEDALTSSVDDLNKTFELIVNESQEDINPKITIATPDEVKTTVTPPKNLLGHPDIPVSSSKIDYKKEKNKIPNEITAKAKIKDSVDVERKVSKNTQTTNKLTNLSDCKLSHNEEYVYKYNFRQVFLQSACQVCKKSLGTTRLACCYCNLVFYCGAKHKDEDWPLHQALCFAVSTIGHLKDQKHIYADTKNITGLDYRLVRMQMIVSCEKILKRRLVPWEQEALLYPRVCAHVPCREWRQTKLTDCRGCGQISYCTANEDHYPKSHSRWCKSYNLYQKLVSYQQSKGRLEPRLPTKVMQEYYVIPDNMNEVLAAMYEEKIDMNDIQYAALTQLATAPLTAAYCYQLCNTKSSNTNAYKKAIFTIHVVGAELQFEADALNKWEVFFLHLRPDLQELRVVLINSNLNPSNLPLDLLGKIKLCEQCRQDKRKVVLRFQDKRTYADYKRSEDFIVPDIVCAFNPSIQRSSAYNGKDPWPSTINVIMKQKIPLIITGYTLTELRKDCIRIKECSEIELKFISDPKMNSFASVRPDRNFITDDEMPLLFKNYCYAIVCG